VVILTYKSAYPELVEQAEKISSTINEEKDKFAKTLDKGLKEFKKLLRYEPTNSSESTDPKPINDGSRITVAEPSLSGMTRGAITGTHAFNLYQTYGFPWELTRDLALEEGLNPDEEEFKAEFKKHQDLSRTASAGDFKGGLADHSETVVRYHTATHLMQKALRTVLGEGVWQKGSNITAERTRFDFTYPQKMTEEQKKQVEDLVNSWIARDLLVTREMVPLEEARKRGAIGLFGEKYADVVSVYTISDPNTGEVVSLEFCGGPHVEHTGSIGKFHIQKEEAVSAGIRRIKGVIE
jgi:alanyl-tRNA synthetase